LIRTLIFILLLFSGPSTRSAAAAAEPIFRLQLSPYTAHFSYSPEHKNVWQVGLEIEQEGVLHGISYFRNSFGQKSAYLYPWGGVHRNLFNVQPLFFKWSIGILYGYKDPYESKVPFNHNGFSPAIVPAIGWTLQSGFSTQLNFLGNSGLMFQISKDL
jgi:hypothetical protein